MDTENESARTSLMRRCICGADTRWPIVKYLSLAFYTAWILLTMTSGVTLGVQDELLAGRYNAMLYLFSGVPLAACLLVSGIFHKQARKLVDKDAFVLAMSAVAGLCTLCIASGLATKGSLPLFATASIGTGLGTSFLCLRIGCVYGDMSRGNPFLIAASACLLSNLLYFMCVGITGLLKDVVVSLLPFIAALCSCTNARNTETARQAEEERIPLSSLSRGYLPKLLIAVFIMCISIGFIRAFAGLSHSPETVAWESNLCVFASFVILAIIVIAYAAALSVSNFEISKIYFPIIIVTASLVVVCSLLGQYVDTLKSVLINTSYNIFIVAIWCILQDISCRTNAGSVRVFGLGRGASAAGTTLGWLLSMMVSQLASGPSAVLPFAFVSCALLVLTAAILLISEGTISIALMRGYAQIATPKPSAQKNENVSPKDNISFTSACEQISQEMHLTAREAQTLELLGRGRTIGFVAEELGISYNTVKGYTKNVYAKCGVHSRQELIDMIEGKLT